MALTEEVVVDQITVLEDGVVLHRTSTRIFRDGVKIAETYHRGSVAPGMDLSGLDPRVSAVAGLMHTDEVKREYVVKTAAKLAEARPGISPVAVEESPPLLIKE